MRVYHVIDKILRIDITELGNTRLYSQKQSADDAIQQVLVLIVYLVNYFLYSVTVRNKFNMCAISDKKLPSD